MKTAVCAGAVPGEGDQVHVFTAEAPVEMGNAGEEGGAVVKQRDMDRHLHAGVVVPANNSASRHASGRNAEDGVLSGHLHHAPQDQLAPAALAGGNAGRDHIRVFLQNIQIFHHSPSLQSFISQQVSYSPG